MDITTLAAWGEFLGGIAVVVSLIYLASQIRQNSKLLKASTASVTYQARSGQALVTIQDPELARIYWAGVANRAALSEADRQRFDPLLGVQFTGDQVQYRLVLDGIVSREAWGDAEQAVRWFATQPGIRQWWAEWSGLYGAPYRAYFDGLIREGEAAG